MGCAASQDLLDESCRTVLHRRAVPGGMNDCIADAFRMRCQVDNSDAPNEKPTVSGEELYELLIDIANSTSHVDVGR